MYEANPKVIALFALVLAAALPAWSQSIQTEGNIETEGQLVSKVAHGTPPLQVSSATKVVGLNADFLDGSSKNVFASDAELRNALADPPCFDNTHRFVNCGNGTVTDTLTGVIWLENANCLGTLDWAMANEAAALLFDGADIDPMGGDCDLGDGSRPGDWRLATKEEWEGIVISGCDDNPQIIGNQSPTTGCYTDNLDPDSEWASGVVSSFYWSSTTAPLNSTFAWGGTLSIGVVPNIAKASNGRLWPVRGGQ